MPSWRNPFAKETDRPQPAAAAQVDPGPQPLRRGRGQLPGRRRQADSRDNVRSSCSTSAPCSSGPARVEAYVDFGKIAEGAVVESRRRQVGRDQAARAAARRDQPRHWRRATSSPRSAGCSTGSVTWSSGDPNRQQEVYQLAEDRITAAAGTAGCRSGPRRTPARCWRACSAPSATRRSPSPTPRPERASERLPVGAAPRRGRPASGPLRACRAGQLGVAASGPRPASAPRAPGRDHLRAGQQQDSRNSSRTMLLDMPKRRPRPAADTGDPAVVAGADKSGAHRGFPFLVTDLTPR